MPDTRLVSIRLPTATAARLHALAATLKRSKSFIGAAAIEEYLSLHEWQVRAIQEGMADADTGRVTDHATVAAWLNRWGTADENDAPPPCN